MKPNCKGLSSVGEKGEPARLRRVHLADGLVTLERRDLDRPVRGFGSPDGFLQRRHLGVEIARQAECDKREPEDHSGSCVHHRDRNFTAC
jgi:hypothetical protein